MNRLNVAFILTLSCVLSACQPSEEHWIVTAPAGSEYTSIAPDSVTILPNGRKLTPRGTAIRVAPHPYGLTISSDGQTVVTANSGVRPFSLSIIEHALTSEPTVRQIPEGAETDEGILAAVFMGTAISDSGDLIYVGGGQEGTIPIFDLVSGTRTGEINANTPSRV